MNQTARKSFDERSKANEEFITDLKKKAAEAASEKLSSGALMKIQEVAALLDLSTTTVHRLPLPSIRLGNSLRFDPEDVKRLIEQCKEPALDSEYVKELLDMCSGSTITKFINS